MKLLKPICALALCTTLACHAQQINPITQAMLKAYNELIKENPKDYTSLFERASQYYQLSQYDNALNDLIRAVDCTPVKEKDMRMREYSLMADVATEMGNYDLALKSVNDALALDPENYSLVYKKGNILLHLNRPEEAYRVYASMQSLKSRSQEAYFGMAKARIMQQNFTEAEDLMKEAENADPSNYLTYCRLGDLYLDMKQPENAATNYLLGFTLAKDSRRPLESLITLASENYNAVATALDFAIEKSENRLPILFLKGNIAVDSGNYSQAEDAFVQLLKIPEARTAGVYAGQARARLGLNDLTGASESIIASLNAEPTSVGYVLKSTIDLGLGNPAQAIVDASDALRRDPSSVDALVAKAEAQIAAADGKGALESLNEAVMVAPDNQKALLLRAYVNENLANNGKAAVGDFNRIILEDAEIFPAIAYKGIAQAKAGKKLDADATVERGLGENPGKDALYWSAVYYAQTGDLEKAKENLQKAIYAGYQNQYELKTSQTPWLTIAPIRHLLK